MIRSLGVLTVSFALASCGSSSGAPAAGNTQTPPQGAEALDAWLATGVYKSWHCEAAAHSPRGPSPHLSGMNGGNRICANDLLSGFTGTGDYPVGSAAVKEVFDSIPPADSTKPMGYAVYLKTGAGDCTSYYFYERVGSTVAADGPGTSGTPHSSCVGCHSAAGKDASHLAAPAGNAHSCVYTQVK
jgi:hypothetical protein